MCTVQICVYIFKYQHRQHVFVLLFFRGQFPQNWSSSQSNFNSTNTECILCFDRVVVNLLMVVVDEGRTWIVKYSFIYIPIYISMYTIDFPNFLHQLNQIFVLQIFFFDERMRTTKLDGWVAFFWSNGGFVVSASNIFIISTMDFFSIGYTQVKIFLPSFPITYSINQSTSQSIVGTEPPKFSRNSDHYTSGRHIAQHSHTSSLQLYIEFTHSLVIGDFVKTTFCFLFHSIWIIHKI